MMHNSDFSERFVKNFLLVTIFNSAACFIFPDFLEGIPFLLVFMLLTSLILALLITLAGKKYKKNGISNQVKALSRAIKSQ